MFYHCLVKYFSVILLLCGISHCQEIQGRVNLGADPNSTTSESFIFAQSVGSGILPLYFDLYNVTDGSLIFGEAFDEDVTVSCKIIPAVTAGDSEIAINSTTIPLRNGNTNGTVSFNIIAKGRRVEVQCSGQTVSTPPGTSYFTPDTSQGRTGFVTIKKDPIVSLCSQQIFVANAGGITTGQVTVRLSEPVQESNVTAKCAVTGVSQDDPTVWLAFDNVSITINEDSAVMGYRILGIGDTLEVKCSAESNDGVQFQTALSESDGTSFIFESGSVEMLPATSTVTSDRFTPLLVLSDPLRPGEGEVIFFCTLTQLNTTDEAQSIIDRGECVAPDDVGATPLAPGTTDFAGITTDQTNAVSNSTLPNTSPAQTSLPLTTPQLPTMLGLTTKLLPTDEPSGNNTATWSLAESQIVFQEGDVEKTLDARLSNAGLGVQGGLLIRCCAAAELNTSPKYTNLSSSAIAVVDVPAAKTINWTRAAVSTELQTETSISNPAYTEVSPCPCDLTASHCDVNCCCDPLCAVEDESTFTCLPGIPGGDFTQQHAYNCSTPDIYRPDWSPFLCVQIDNSPYLGLYFTARPGARDAAAYNNLKATTATQTLTSFEDSGQRSLVFEDVDASGVGYRFGFPVETLFDNGARGFLALPEVDPNGGCSWLSPIQFQMDSASRCNVDPQQSLCTESSILSPRAFALSTNIGYPPCSEAPGILTRYGGSNPTPTTVRYYCRDDITPYVVSSKNLGQLFPPNGESLFPGPDSSNGIVPLPDRCVWDDGYTLPDSPQYNQTTYLCSNSVLDVRYELFWRGDELLQVDAIVVLSSVALSPQGSTVSTGEKETPFVSPPPTEPPTTPLPVATTTEEELTQFENVTDLTTFTDGMEMLSTAVVETTVSMTTEAQTTQAETTQSMTTASATTDAPTTPSDVTVDSGVMATASSVITDSPDGVIVQVSNTPLPFTQRFSVKFTHLPTPLADPAPVAPPEVVDQETRSGSPGYVTGRRVLSGLAVECNDTGECAPVDPNQPGDSVLIDDAEANRLRVWVPGPGSLCSQSSLADVTFGENHISGCILRLGWAQLSNCTALRDMMLSELQTTVAADRIGKIGNASVEIQDNWAPVFKSQDYPVPTDVPPTTEAMTTDALTTDAMTTDAMTTSEFFNETGPRPLDLLQGLCYDIPTGVNIEILYADAGEFGALIQREILSAYITYSRSTVQLQCVGASGFACHLNQTSATTTDWVQSFPVTSTVTFIKVQSGGPRRCYNDQCEEEMYFPLSPRFQGDPWLYTVGMAIFLLLLAIAYLAAVIYLS